MTKIRIALAAATAALALQPLALSAHEMAAGSAGKAPQSKQTISEDQLPLDPRFSADRFKADVAFLADDLLEGRDTGSVGYEIAARFVAQRFAALGLQPAGDLQADGKRSWYQQITFQKTERDGAAGTLAIAGPAGTKNFTHGVDAVIGLNANEPKLNVSAPLVFVGYGMENKRLGLDDYAGLDVKGKIVVILRGFPGDLPSEEAAYASSAATKYEIAQAHGAIGVITVGTNVSLKVRPWERSLQTADSPSITWVGKDGKAFDETPGIRAAAAVNDVAAAAIFAGAPQTLAQIRTVADRKGGRPKGFPLKTSVTIQGQSKTSRVTSPNVVAMLPGSDPTLKDEYIALSGHLDHIGISPERPGDPKDKDRINNGAMDNAAGVATLLEVARVLGEDKAAPRRSVIFLASTGEEKGLLGADYFARHPSAPIEKIVGNVDLDMPLLSYPFADVTAYGADHSTIGAQVRAAIAPMKLSLAPDPTPEETIFVRSDHYMFVKQGVPAVFLCTGYGNGGQAHWEDFLQNRYHLPNDDMNQPVIWRAAARFAEANYRITRAMADANTPPEWYKGDFFGDLFAPSRPKATAR